MQIQITGEDLKEIFFQQNFPENYSYTRNDYSERSTHLNNSFGKGIYREIYFEGMHLGFGDMMFHKPVRLLFETDYQTVEMHFALSGSTYTKIKGFPDYEFEGNYHNIIYAPEVKGNMLFSGSHSQLLEINILPEVFLKYLPDNGMFDSFIELLRKRVPAQLSKQQMPITPEMMRIINELIHFDNTIPLRRLFIEQKVLELLLLQLRQLNSPVDPLITLSQRDIYKIQEAKLIIEMQIDNPCSLIDLARKVGTNEFKLKKGFKELFGTTVFGMVADLRMEQAKQLLLGKDKNITEISEIVGYKNATHFTQAFKKKFGVTPTMFAKCN